MADVLRWSQTVIDLADGDPSKGNLICRVSVGVRIDDAGRCPVCAWVVLDGATTATRPSPWPAAPTPCPTPLVVAYVYCARYPNGVLLPDDTAVREIAEALRIAERSGDDLALGLAPG